MRRQPIPSKEDIMEYYIIGGHSVKECLDRFQVSYTQFHRWLDKYGIEKNYDSALEKVLKAHPNLTKDVVCSYYLGDNHTLKECIDHFQTSRYEMLVLFRNYGLKKTSEQKTINAQKGKTEEIKAKAREKAAKTLEERYGVSSPLKIKKAKDGLQRYMEKHTIPVPEKEELERVYKESHSMEECATVFGVSRDTIIKWCSIYGIKKTREEIDEAVRKTSFDRYGKNYFAETAEYREKTMATNMKKYGRKSQQSVLVDHYDIWSDQDKFVSFLKDYSVPPSIHELAQFFNVSHSTILAKVKLLGVKDLVDLNPPRSHYEDEIIDFLRDELGITNIIPNARDVIPYAELDVYLPDYGVGIEFNGAYWHSELKEKHHWKTRHQEKSERFRKEAGIFVFHIYEHEWDDRYHGDIEGLYDKEAIKAKLRFLLSPTPRALTHMPDSITLDCAKDDWRPYLAAGYKVSEVVVPGCWVLRYGTREVLEWRPTTDGRKPYGGNYARISDCGRMVLTKL